MTEPRLSDYLSHILDAIGRIQNYVAGFTREDFVANDLVQDAVIRNIEIIGEASNRIMTRHPAFATAHPELELPAAYSMRNVVAHGYFGVDLARVWDTIGRDLPALATAVRAAREGLDSENLTDR